MGTWGMFRSLYFENRKLWWENPFKWPLGCLSSLKIRGETWSPLHGLANYALSLAHTSYSGSSESYFLQFQHISEAHSITHLITSHFTSFINQFKEKKWRGNAKVWKLTNEFFGLSSIPTLNLLCNSEKKNHSTTFCLSFSIWEFPLSHHLWTDEKYSIGVGFEVHR